MPQQDGNIATMMSRKSVDSSAKGSNLNSNFDLFNTYTVHFPRSIIGHGNDIDIQRTSKRKRTFEDVLASTVDIQSTGLEILAWFLKIIFQLNLLSYRI